MENSIQTQHLNFKKMLHKNDSFISLIIELHISTIKPNQKAPNSSFILGLRLKIVI